MFNPYIYALSPFEFFLYQSPVLLLILWTLVYIGDYALTIISARLYRRINHIIEYEGSYELTPQFQEDINALRLISPRFVWAVVLSWLILSISWLVFAFWFNLHGVFGMLYGVVMVREGVIYLRHMRNLALFRQLVKDESAIEGKMLYKRWLIYRSSAGELWNNGVLFLVLAVWVNSYFLLGGAISLFLTGYQHWRLGKKSKEAGRQAV
ncbi:MAG: hypothetical protein DWQ07_14250 [Chloroflexi bacterium]|nr:MAG: hypothetical protein DWQ07_14250 [Chloroflexota bacterium]MBL1195755.1 hypothetical protein [Chloroflexota bacterium]NOH13044.1 hypothetical protein [Chloroflexota bacterium]